MKNFREAIKSEDYWMGLAFWIAPASRSSHPQGAVVVGPQNNFLCCGYNSPPKVMLENQFLRPAEKAVLQDSRLILVHGSTLYTTHTPSLESILDIIAYDIKRIVYFPTKTIDPTAVNIARQAYVPVQKFNGNLNWMRDHISLLTDAGIFS